jgi:hypothetical protein
MSAMIHHCALPDKSICEPALSNPARTDGHVPVAATSRFLTDS